MSSSTRNLFGFEWNDIANVQLFKDGFHSVYSVIILVFLGTILLMSVVTLFHGCCDCDSRSRKKKGAKVQPDVGVAQAAVGVVNPTYSADEGTKKKITRGRNKRKVKAMETSKQIQEPIYEDVW